MGCCFFLSERFYHFIQETKAKHTELPPFLPPLLFRIRREESIVLIAYNTMFYKRSLHASQLLLRVRCSVGANKKLVMGLDHLL